METLSAAIFSRHAPYSSSSAQVPMSMSWMPIVVGINSIVPSLTIFISYGLIFSHIHIKSMGLKIQPSAPAVSHTIVCSWS